MENKRSINQLKLYFKYIKQLRQANKIKINIDGEVMQFRFTCVKNPRYLLKALDLELPTTNDKFPLESANKNEFHKTDMTDLTHHISFLRELLWDNKIIPFNEVELYKD